jgi:hypothetical protein
VVICLQHTTKGRIGDIFLLRRGLERNEGERERERAEVTPKVQSYGHVLFLLYSTATHNNNNGT